MTLPQFLPKSIVQTITKTVGVCGLVGLGLIGCTEPSTTQVTPNTSVDPSTGTETVTLDEAADRIEQAIDNNSALQEFDLEADDEDNAIVLKGDVRDASQKTLAEDLAKRAAPNAAIVNQIEIKP